METCLRSAILVGDVEAVRQIIRDHSGLLDSSFPLHICASNEVSQHLVEILIELGADVDAQDGDGFAPIHRFFCLVKFVVNTLKYISIYYYYC